MNPSNAIAKAARKCLTTALKLTQDGDACLAMKDFEGAGAYWAQALKELDHALQLDPSLLPTWLGYMEVKP